MQILDGKIVSQAVKDNLKQKTLELTASGKRAPHLAAILIGHNGASETYVASKVKNCEEIGFTSSLIRFDDSVDENILINTIRELNEDTSIDGILVQLPLPKNISEDKIISLIDPKKDVDGFHPVNIGKMIQGLPSFAGYSLWYFIDA